MKNLIGINDFVKRQTKESRFTYFDGTWEELAELTTENFINQQPGYRDGVILISVPAERFYTKGEYILGKEYKAVYKPRRDGEEPYMQIINEDPKVPCNFVDVVLYRDDVLAENDENSTDCLWEIVSINGKVEAGKEPMHPITMARNFLEMKGGTKGDFTAEDFAKSIVYWSKRDW